MTTEHKPDVWPELPEIDASERDFWCYCVDDLHQYRKLVARECWKVIQHSLDDCFSDRSGKCVAAELLEERFGPFDE